MFKSQLDVSKKNDIIIQQADYLFTMSISPQTDEQSPFDINERQLGIRREKTIAHLVEEKLFERSMRSNASVIRKGTTYGNRDWTSASKKNHLKGIDEESDMMKNLKVSLMHSIVNQHEKASARSASVESQRQTMFVKDLEENPLMYSPTQSRNVIPEEPTELLNSMMRSSTFGSKKIMDNAGVLHEVRSQASSQEDFSVDSIEEEVEDFQNDLYDDMGTEQLRMGKSEKEIPITKFEDDEFVLDQQMVEDQVIDVEIPVQEPVKAEEDNGQLANVNQFFKTLQEKKGASRGRDSKDKLMKMKTLMATTTGSQRGKGIATPASQLDPFSMQIQYKSIDDDVVDKMLEKFVQTHKVQVPINRIDPSKYLFGTRIISAQIINGVLMVRVGGGFMNIEEFIFKHSDKEILCLKLKMTKDRKKLPKITQELIEKHKIKKFI